jgi:hypothetical protein
MESEHFNNRSVKSYKIEHLKNINILIPFSSTIVLQIDECIMRHSHAHSMNEFCPIE